MNDQLRELAEYLSAKAEFARKYAHGGDFYQGLANAAIDALMWAQNPSSFDGWRNTTAPVESTGDDE